MPQGMDLEREVYVRFVRPPVSSLSLPPRPAGGIGRRGWQSGGDITKNLLGRYKRLQAAKTARYPAVSLCAASSFSDATNRGEQRAKPT